MEKLTIKEALEQGYTMYGVANKEWQHANEINDDVFKEVHRDDWGDIVLFEQNSSCPSIDKKYMAEMLADHISDNDSQECARDDDSVYKTVKEIDYTDIVAKINKELEQHKYWMLTTIKLIPNE